MVRGQLPLEAVEAVRRIAGTSAESIATFGAAEAGIELPPGVPLEHIDHHRGHAVTAYATSPFHDAIVLVCDGHAGTQLTVWQANGSALEPLEFPWQGQAFATLYSRATHALSLDRDGDEHRLESLARAADGVMAVPEQLVELESDGLVVLPSFEGTLRELASAGPSRGVEASARLAAGVQDLLARRLIEVVADIKRRFGGRHLCVGGGLFFNTAFNTAIAQSAQFERLFVPVNPGNAGVALGAAIAVNPAGITRAGDTSLSPFLGPRFDPGEIKATLDNCKLSYDYVTESSAVERTVKALAAGKLVGWFQGSMEWGPRALGHRSILASPVAPFVLENINLFLKHREPYRTYGVSVCQEDLPRFFEGPSSSPVMEYDYVVKDVEALRALLPLNASRLRVHTVSSDDRLFRMLLQAFGSVTGLPILVNTSFNGFNEPIVCTPRDAVRVFFGTGLDMAVLGNFILTK
jgi:carbamoyltransferase